MLTRADLAASSVQDKNAGNSGDLVKHTVYLALLLELTRHSPWKDRLSIVEAHAGKGVYLSTSSHLREFHASLGYEETLLGAAQTRAFAELPAGLGSVADVDTTEIPYAGSAVLHSLALSGLPGGRLLLFDHNAGVRQVVDRVFQEPALLPFRERLHLSDVDQGSEKLVLAALTSDQYRDNHILHFDPFAFVMSEKDGEARATYRALLRESDERVAQAALGAASVFFTWGSNSSAALADLDGTGHAGGLEGGYQDLLGLVNSGRRVVITWCWVYYFSMLLVVPSALRPELARGLERHLAPLSGLLSRLEII